ncbi:MAG: gamma-glutamyltransferase, partial [Actinomycetota bacterium]
QRGHLTVDDLVSYEVIERTPLEVRIEDDRVLLNPPPAVGGVLIAHTLGQLATTSFVDLARAIDATGALLRAGNGNLETFTALANSPVRQRGTTHISVVDADGRACSITTSNGEGNGEIVDGFGFMLNNILGEDDVNPAGDDWPVDTRLSSMMCPTLIEHHDGAITAMGSGGSSRIRSAISQVVARLCLDADNLSAAVATPRVHVDEHHLDVEPIDDSIAFSELLAAFPDHRRWHAPDLYFGGVHAARLGSDASLVGVGDHRRNGATFVVDD